MERSRRAEFITTSRSLNRASLPWRLYEKAKKFGIWNPSEIDFQQDIRDWAALSEMERDLLLRLTALFQAGEEAVTVDLLPLIRVMAAERRLEEEIYLTSFLFDEARHTDFFRRFLDEVAGEPGNLSHYHTDHYRTIFYDQLPAALSALDKDASLTAQVRASVTYNMIVEGVLAETGYHAYLSVLQRNGIMPGVQRGVALLKQDESRHLAYGVYLLSRLLAEDGSLWAVLEETMNSLLPPAIGVIGDAFAYYDPMPFGLLEADFIDYAMDQFTKRYTRLERARGASMEEINQAALASIGDDEV